MAEINERLCKALAQSGTQFNAVVEKTGINPRSLSNYKKSTEIPSSALAKIIDALNISPDYLLFGRGPMFREEKPKPTYNLEADGDIISQVADGSNYGYATITNSQPASSQPEQELRTLRDKLIDAEKQIRALTDTNLNLSLVLARLAK